MAETGVIMCLKSEYNKKYLRYRSEEVQTHGLLQFAADNVMDPYAQFEVENSNIEGLIHLKCRYTNKYLVRWSPNHYWITASANTKDESQDSWTCTLFKPIYIGDAKDQKMRLLHVQLGHYACLWRIGAPFDSCLFAGSKDINQESQDVFTFVYWDSLFSFPRQVAFKGDNGNYLGVLMKDGIAYLQFSYANPKDPQVEHEIYATRDGTLCIKSTHLGKFWRLGNDDWLIADADDPRGTNNAAAMFRPTVLDVNVIALLNMSKTWFCKRLTRAGFVSCMNAAIQDIDKHAKLEVIDLAKAQ